MSQIKPDPQQPEAPTVAPKAAEGSDAHGGGTGGALTQEQVNELVGRTRTEARQRAQAELLQQLGVETPEALAERMQRLQELEQEKLSEAERVQKRVEELQAQLEARDTAVSEAQRQIQQMRIEQAVQQAATAASFRNPADALAFIDVGAVTVDDGGRVEGVEDLIKALAAERPYLLDSTPARTARTARPASTTTQGNGSSNQPSQKRHRLNF